jgi:cell division transport system permease protein
MASGSKKTRRKLLTFLRIIRYGTDSFIRNSWLSIAATAVMTITLLIIFTTFIAQNVLNDTLGDLRNKVDMSIYLKTDTSDETGAKLVKSVEKLSSVRSAKYISAAEARKIFVETNKNDNNVLEAIKEATNKTPATLRVVVEDINNTSQLQSYVKNDSEIKKYINPDFKPSFAGERRNTIESIGRAVSFAQKIGIIAGVIFVIISSLIIFNTIRMAIFNRKEEIQMMKLIGANQSFIRGPFLVESIVYGFIAALVATGCGVWGLYAVSKTLMSYQISIQPTINFIDSYVILVALCMIIIGAVIGIISSLLATHRYLKL